MHTFPLWQLLALLCQPAEVLAYIDMPSSLAVWGIDSGIRHAVTGADYGSVRIGAWDGIETRVPLPAPPPPRPPSVQLLQWKKTKVIRAEVYCHSS